MAWKPVACLFLLFELIAAQVFFSMPASFFEKTYKPGDDMNITWLDARGLVTLNLLDDYTNKTVVLQIATDIPLSQNSYNFTLPASRPDGWYAFEILDTTGQNWSGWFDFTGGTPATPESSIGPPNNTSTSPASTSSTASSTTTSHSGLSTGDKAAIGVGAALGAVIIAILIWLAWWHGRRSAKKQAREKSLSPEQSPRSPTHGLTTSPYPPSYTPDISRAMSPELGADEPRRDGDLTTIASTVGTAEALSEDEKRELQRRRRAAELEGSAQAVVPGVVSERAELEARRKGASWETTVLSL